MNLLTKKRLLSAGLLFFTVIGVIGCGSDGELAKVITLGSGSRAAWNAWEDKGGLNKDGGNKLYGLEITGISTSYYKGSGGPNALLLQRLIGS